LANKALILQTCFMTPASNWAKQSNKWFQELWVWINTLFLDHISSNRKWVRQNEPNRSYRKVYKATLDYYTEKQHVAPVKRSRLSKAFMKIKTTFERIVVPFTDGIKSLNVVTDLKWLTILKEHN
jgi:hypothetical protein